jgi:hypothetical protein
MKTLLIALLAALAINAFVTFNVHAQGVARLVHCQMVQDRVGFIWIGTYSNGITTFTLTFPYYCPSMVNL